MQNVDNVREHVRALYLTDFYLSHDSYFSDRIPWHWCKAPIPFPHLRTYLLPVICLFSVRGLVRTLRPFTKFCVCFSFCGMFSFIIGVQFEIQNIGSNIMRISICLIFFHCIEIKGRIAFPCESHTHQTK